MVLIVVTVVMLVFYIGVPVDNTVVEYFDSQDEWLEARGRFL